MFNQEVLLLNAFILYKIAQSHTCQKWPAIESEWGSMKVKPFSHCTLVPENCVPSVWTQTRPGIDPGLGPSNIAGFSPGTSAVWTKAGSMP